MQTYGLPYAASFPNSYFAQQAALFAAPASAYNMPVPSMHPYSYGYTSSGPSAAQAVRAGVKRRAHDAVPPASVSSDSDADSLLADSDDLGASRKLARLSLDGRGDLNGHDRTMPSAEVDLITPSSAPTSTNDCTAIIVHPQSAAIAAAASLFKSAGMRLRPARAIRAAAGGYTGFESDDDDDGDAAVTMRTVARPIALLEDIPGRAAGASSDAAAMEAMMDVEDVTAAGDEWSDTSLRFVPTLAPQAAYDVIDDDIQL